MKKIGTLNAQLSGIIAAMGHSDRLVICDSGLPIPNGSRLVDLALTVNIPRFVETLSVVLEELQVERMIVASEMIRQNGAIYDAVEKLANGVEIRTVSHEEFKQMTREGDNIAFVRTGEASPYANAILVSGVTF